MAGVDLNRTVSSIMGGLDYAVVIVTADDGQEKAGCLVGFWSGCSIHPPRFMVWISKENRTYDVAVNAGTIAVHFVDRDRYELAKLFATASGDDIDKFALCRWRRGAGDAVILEECPRWVVGRILGRCDAGDHEGFLIEPVDAAAGPWPGQLGYQAVKDLDAGHPA